MYDHTIQGIKSNNTKLHFKKIGLRGESDNKENFLLTMNEIIIENGHMNEKDMMLKIDCEGCEWTSFIDMPHEIFQKFSQIIVEYHINDLNNTGHFQLIARALKKINLTHQPFYIHINNCGSKANYGNFHKFDLLEVSYSIGK